MNPSPGLRYRLLALLFLLALLTLAGLPAAVAATPESGSDAVPGPGMALKQGDPWRAVGLAAAAALAVGLSVIGASHAVARVGSAAFGTAAERPELLIRSLLFVALAEGLAVLGFAVAMILAQKI